MFAFSSPQVCGAAEAAPTPPLIPRTGHDPSQHHIQPTPHHLTIPTISWGLSDPSYFGDGAPPLSLSGDASQTSTAAVLEAAYAKHRAPPLSPIGDTGTQTSTSDVLEAAYAKHHASVSDSPHRDSLDPEEDAGRVPVDAPPRGRPPPSYNPQWLADAPSGSTSAPAAGVSDASSHQSLEHLEQPPDRRPDKR
jgi:hypothetical protein